MKFLCTGVNRETGARMTLEFDAPSKAAAEHKAELQGMEVLHAHEVHDGELPVERHVTAAKTSTTVGGKGKLIALAVILVVLVVLAVMFWSRISALLHR